MPLPGNEKYVADIITRLCLNAETECSQAPNLHISVSDPKVLSAFLHRSAVLVLLGYIADDNHRVQRQSPPLTTRVSTSNDRTVFWAILRETPRIARTIFAGEIATEVLKKLASVLLQEIGLAWGVKDELVKLNDTLCAIKSVLLDAEEQQRTKHGVRDWLEKLKDVIYDMDDVLDDYATEATRREALINGNLLKKVGNFFSWSNPIAFSFKMGHRIHNFRGRLEQIAANSEHFHFRNHVETHVNGRVREQTYSFVLGSDVIGRDYDKDRLVELLQDSTSIENVSVIPIVGLGGLGKTILTKLVCIDPRVVQFFNLIMWVCVPEDFNLKKLLEKIIKSATGSDCGHLEIDQLQCYLHGILNKKKFLLVLDDVWNVDSRKWMELRNMLISGTCGSKIIVTTRSNMVAEYMGTVAPYKLGNLLYKDCLSIFFKHASRERKESINPKLVEIGKAIVRKCGGNPLAVITLGSHLSMKDQVREWLYVRDCDIWKLKQNDNDILPVLKLSYDQMPSHLKPCFAYCAVFPKDYEIWRVDLINLWIAQGYITKPAEGNLEVEDIGNQYFNELLTRSLFQDVDVSFDSEILTCKMHDLVHDLAQLVAGGDSAIVSSTDEIISRNVRNVLFSEYDLYCKQFPRSLYKLKQVRTFMFAFQVGRIDSFVDKLIPKFRYLRVLDLSQSEFKELSSSFGYLKHLRYLNLSWNRAIKRLPDSLCQLVNLQTLILLDCEQLEDLPRDMGTMKNLRHLYLTSQLKFLSYKGSECFTSLKTLWLVKCPELMHLSFGTQHFKSLSVLRIVGCPKLTSLPSNMEHLAALEKLWIVDCAELTLSEDDQCLEGLKNLQSLYLGKLPKLMGFPQGLREAASSLQYLRIAECTSLNVLPEWLQDFRFLLELHIQDCQNLLCLPKETKFLTALKVLNIRNSPHLSRTCIKTGSDWSCIAHITSICIRSGDAANRQAIAKEFQGSTPFNPPTMPPLLSLTAIGAFRDISAMEYQTCRKLPKYISGRGNEQD